MKSCISTWQRRVAGMTGYCLLRLYKSYLILAPKKQSYLEMAARIPVKREVLLMKQRKAVAACLS